MPVTPVPGLPPSAEELIALVARGDERAFATLYDQGAARVFGLVRRVLVDSAQAEEVTQEVWLQVWQSATRFDAGKGKAMSWILTLAHRRAVDRVRSAQSSTARERTALFENVLNRPFDEVAEAVEATAESRRVRHCVSTLTELQRQSVELAYYQGLTYREIGLRLDVALPTIKTRMRDGMIRLRDCLTVTSGA
ncbi:ECF RNA polymerase sigma factor SigK [Amycolatopsis sp. H20-H5]|nr:ECF RNA polymerase sigma factor SigK [Amycolatopsis sp. H20-H5]MEC3981305.1 ECF RNA polymerase sigma factor SigK [Amycolatopsis sp. H20-H5]